MKCIHQVQGTFDTRNQEKKCPPPTAAVARLPRYYRYLSLLLDEGTLRISSTDLAARMGLSASQVRQDFSRFGDFGQQGYGYNVKYLFHKIAALLGAGGEVPSVWIGDPKKISAILGDRGTPGVPGECLAVFFDGEEPGNPCLYPTSDLETVLRDTPPTLAVLCVPSDLAGDFAVRLAACGIRGILNLSGYELDGKALGIPLENLCPADAYLRLCYEINEKEAHHV